MKKLKTKVIMKKAEKNGMKALVVLALVANSAVVNANPLNGELLGPKPEVSLQSKFKLQKHNSFAVASWEDALQFNENKLSTFVSEDEEDEDDVFWIQMVTPQRLVFTTAVVYFEGGQDHFCDDDSEQPDGVSEAFYSKADDTKVVINGRAPFREDDVVELGSKHYTGGEYTIRMFRGEGVFSSTQSVYLYDKVLNVKVNLSEENYTFVAQAGELEGRFQIVYTSTFAISNPTVNKAEDVKVYQTPETINLQAKDAQMQVVEMYDCAGRQIFASNPKTKSLAISSSSFKKGLYIVRVQTKNGLVVKKIRI